MHGDNVGSAGHEFCDVAERVDNHQVDIEQQIRHSPECFHNGHAKREVRHEIAIHHVNMQGPCAPHFQPGNLAGEICEIARKQRRQNRVGLLTKLR